MNKKSRIFNVICWFFIIAFLLVTVFPFFWIVISSFKPETEIFGANSYRIIAENPTMESYRIVIFEKGMLRAVGNSFAMSMLTTLYVVVVASMSAYIISRFKFRGKSLLMGLILTVAMFPQIIVVGPVFNLYYKADLLNSYWVCLAYSSITLPSAVWIMVAHFKQVPLALEEAARIDGCSTWGILWRIIFPIAAPGVFTTGIMSFIAAWNEYLLSCTLNIDERMQTVPVRLSSLKDQFTIFWSQVAAATVIVVIPTLLIVLLFQKQIVAGIANGAVKE